MKFTPEHEALRQTWKTLIDREINPHVDEWEKEGAFPAHELFKKMGDAGLLGVDKPVEFGGSGLDFSYAMICSESLGLVNGGSIPMATGVQISMATPALARYGSDELRQEFLAPSISGDYVACLGVSETGAGSDVASIKTTARRVGGDWVINGGKMWTTNGAQADWMCLLANTGDGQAHKNKSLIVVPMKTKGVTDRQEARQARHARLGHRADLLRRGEGAGALHDRRSRARASSTRCSSSRRSGCGPAPAR